VRCDERRVVLQLGTEIVSLLDSYRPRKRRRSEEMALLTGLLLCSGRSWQLKFLALPAERTSCIFPHGIT
jgi:hypothetical protein